MADIRAFRALRFDEGTAGPLSDLICPPYDVISPDEQQALYERSPHNDVRVEYGIQRETDTESHNRYTRAADDLARWRTEGILALDDPPAI
ncbi:MAG: DUF1015 family protein, partial [Candidatus Limnocylindria bacterium]|nr:DUF1015 family protein [Candidatus Limnocylindria bacterium]